MASARTILEELNFDQLFAYSEPKRVLRSKTVRGPALAIDSFKDGLRYRFNFKAFPSTEHKRHKGYIEFKKPEDPDTPLEQVPCVVDCDCKDYMYRWAYSNMQRDAGKIGSDSINGCINQAPRVTNPGNIPGLCKHLLALRNFLYGQDSTFPPSDDPDDPTIIQKMAAKHAEYRRLDALAKSANKAIINPEGEQIGTVNAEGEPIIATAPEPGPPTAGSALASLQNQELELRRRQQVRTQGGNPNEPGKANQEPQTTATTPLSKPKTPPVPPVGPKMPPRTNPTNPRNQRSTGNRRNNEPPPETQGESLTVPNVFNNMDSKIIQLVQEVVDSNRAAVEAAPAAPVSVTPPLEGEGAPKTPSEQALAALQSIERLLGELVQLQQTPEPEPEVEVDQEVAPEEPPVQPVAAPAAKPPGRPMTARKLSPPTV